MKKKLIYILILTIIAIGILSPLSLIGINIASAETTLLNQQVSCGLLSGGGLSGCLAVISSYAYGISALLLEGTGYMFDSFLAFSLSNDVLNQDFISTAWGAMRGFVNLLFILVLVAISISIILDYGEFNSKTLIRDVIIIALLVNFSLFAAKIVIDTSNIVALGFYDSIGAEVKNKSNIKNIKLGEKNISGQIMSLFNPARLIDVASFEKWSDENSKKNKSLTDSNIMIAVVYIVGTAMSVYMAYLFFMAAWIFLVRIVYLWIIMVLAPLAFIAYVIPTFKSQWTKWWKELFDKSFCIVAFMFMLWLTLLIMGDSFFDGAFDTKNADKLVEMITIIVLKFVMVAVLFGKTLKITRSMCDEGGVGDKVLGWAKSGVGLVAGGLTGGASLAAGFGARQIIGRGAAATGEALEKSSFATGRMGKLALKNLRKVGDVKFGAKEGYISQQVTGAQEHKSYIESLPTTEYTDPKTGLKTTSQEVARKKLSERSILSTVTGGRTGASKYLEYEVEMEKLKNDKKLAERDLSKAKDIVNANKAGLVTDTMRDNVFDEQEKVDAIKEQIKEVNEKMKKPKKS